MNRIQSIISAATACADNPGTFNKLSIGAKHDVVTSCAWRSINAKKFWEEVLEDENANENFKKRAIKEINTQEQVFNSACSELDRMSNFSEGQLRELMCDTAFLEITADEAGNSESHISGDAEFAYTVINGNPYARGKTGLIEAGIWPEHFHRVDQLMLGDLHKTYAKAAAQYLGRALLAAMGKIDHANERDARQVEIASCLQPFPVQPADILTLIKRYPPVTWVRGDGTTSVRKQWSAEELVMIWKEAKRLDEIDALKEAADTAVTAAIKTTVVLGVLTDSVAKMKEAGVSDALIESVTKQIMAATS